ncbi:GNAT family N-acetyltransferase [Pseudogulbenkiania ferrooxidans]|uniref:Alanine acetyltransferase n=1 Tax=Pseudogulbenkiania ferrooxidans EGD-HP2 TaxID=1388764 RepID=A0ABN0N5Z3_9NEIS|nr:GNAT family N-acetyltransferase [Pseudogulbenkiania ferrooxidans]ERE06334.1 alanine acetyltransferase [Pseudogulbenkiania ferrooxidans EGD-HP2]
MSFDLPTLDTPRLRLLPAAPELAAAMLSHWQRNREHFAPWDPKPGPDFFTEGYWTKQLAQRAQAWREGREARYVLTLREAPERIIGTASLSNIVRGVFQACHLGYGIDQDCEGQGLMREALQAVIRLAFDELKLHRIQANYQPQNTRSGALLRRLGFVEEGVAKDYLFINGEWRDHALTSLRNPDFDASALLA